jgi:hypothetical protein
MQVRVRPIGGWRRAATPSTLSDSWNANLPPELRESLDYSRAARGKLDTLEAEFLRRSQQAVPGSADRHQEMDRLRTDIHHATEEWMALTKRPPVEKPVDMWQNFGSPATIVAMLGGLFARHHLSASLNAAGMAMQAINTNNHQQFKQQWDTWKTETEYGLKLIDLKQREIDDILKDDKLAWDRKMAEMKTITDLAGMTEHSAERSDDVRGAEQFAHSRRDGGGQGRGRPRLGAAVSGDSSIQAGCVLRRSRQCREDAYRR